MTIAAQTNTTAQAAEQVLAADIQNLAARREAAHDAAENVINSSVANVTKKDAGKKLTLKNVLKFTAATAVVAGAGFYLYKRFTAGDSVAEIVSDAAQAVTPAE